MRGCFSYSIVSRTIQEMTTFKFKFEVVFIMYTVIERSLNCLFRNEATMSFSITPTIKWFPVCPALRVAFLVEVWKDSWSQGCQSSYWALYQYCQARRKRGCWVFLEIFFLEHLERLRLNFNGWFMEAKSWLEAPSWVCGCRHKSDDQGSQTAKSWLRKVSCPVWAKSFKRKKWDILTLRICRG